MRIQLYLDAIALAGTITGAFFREKTRWTSRNRWLGIQVWDCEYLMLSRTVTDE